ncbi:MAG: ArsR/SmtB family transcription factor [Ktedonobacterales bacterium]
MQNTTDLIGDHSRRDLKEMLKALGDVSRLHMIEILSGVEEMTVTDLIQALLAGGRLAGQPLVSWHLSILRRAGLVRTRRRGRQVYCSLDMNRYQLCLRKLSELVTEEKTPRETTATPAASPPPDGATGMLGVHHRG